MSDVIYLHCTPRMYFRLNKNEDALEYLKKAIHNNNEHNTNIKLLFNNVPNGTECAIV